jgi:hypothetical protein
VKEVMNWRALRIKLDIEPNVQLLVTGLQALIKMGAGSLPAHVRH